MKENADTARSLDTAAIAQQLKESAEQAFRLRFQMSMGQTEGVNKVRKIRKERARMLTVLRERELGIERGAKPAAEPKKKTAVKKAPAKKAAAKKKASE